jgi:phosphoglycerate dehydrogenase-like enzyme
VKVVYFVRNPGIAGRTPPTWRHAVVSPDDQGGFPPERLDEVGDADVLVAGLDPVDDHLLARAPGLKLIQRLGVGHDSVDLEAAARRGVPVANVPDYNSGAVAEHTLMLALALLRRVFEASLLMKAGRWPIAHITARGVYGLEGRTLGLLGFGAIGRAVAARAEPFGVHVLYWDRRRPADGLHGAEPATLDELLAQSDVVSLHLPLTPRTRTILDRRRLAAMKPGALLINTARGALVDEEALAEALSAGRLAGAGLDVFAREPLDPRHPLRHCPNVLLTPHLAGQTREAMERAVEAVHENLARVKRGKDPRDRVG